MVLKAVDGVTEDQARWKPAPDRWTILEYVEHLAVSSDALALVKKSLETPAVAETAEERGAREQKLRETPVPRGANRAPAHLKPVARFATLADAVAFLAARERTVEFALHFGRFAPAFRAPSGVWADGRLPVALRKCAPRRNPRRPRSRNPRHAGFPAVSYALPHWLRLGTERTVKATTNRAARVSERSADSSPDHQTLLETPQRLL